MNTLPPDDRLSTVQAQLTRVARAIEGARRAEMAALDLTPVQADALRFAGTIRPDVATVGQLARVLGVRHTTALGVLRPLTDRDLIERLPHPYSERQHILALTSTGRALLDRLDAIESSVTGVLATLPPGDLAALEGGLGGVVRGMAREGLLVTPAPCGGCVYFERDADQAADTPHYCRLIKRYLSDPATQMPCPEHQPAASTTP